ncbi:MAG: leucine--tRNA ligase [Firmicutes bacterium]|nr:leucine--tRNA ligase [Bacillota bacterium]
MEYDFRKIEKKWQDFWKKTDAFKAEDFSSKPKFYVLSEFFGPSGKGIHLGHVKCFTPTEVIARYKRLKGYNVLYPVGWDAFGLPTENSALKENRAPADVTEKNIGIFTNQLTKLGFSFDWSREVSTTDPAYYRWTQWIFLQLFKNGMAYKADGVVSFCPSCKTVLSNEDSQGGICDRCKSAVEQRKRSVWYLRMKDYSEKMLAAISDIDMKPSLKDSQQNWIGKSDGAEVTFQIASDLRGEVDSGQWTADSKADGNLVGSQAQLTPQKLATDHWPLATLKIFTTRPDTLYGVTYMAIAPEHPLIEECADQIANIKEIRAYRNQAAKKTAEARAENKEKTGIRIDGLWAVNPINNAQIPIYVADYVMMGYGTGAIMAVPGHDTRDYEFAKKFGLPIIEVISGGDISKEAYTGDGILVNSPLIDGLHVPEAKKKITAYLEKIGAGIAKTNYKMQDWPFNRQRYWGEPFPIVICDTCGYVAVPESELPLRLPKLSDYSPDESGNGPLSKAVEWVQTTCPKCGKPARRETDTMPNWAGSSWYWLRFLDPHNEKEFVSPEKLMYWGAVDLYTGGTEHVTRHMLYASFWHNFLCDIGAVPHRLPFTRRMCNGLILDDKGKKMGKSSGNAIDPIKIIDQFGADAFRLHILFMGDYEQNTMWSLDGINGCTNFLRRVWNLPEILRDSSEVSKEHERALHLMIKRADTGIISDGQKSYDERGDFKFNTVIASFMEFMNAVRKSGFITREELRQYLIAMNPFIPHITSELYEQVFGGDILKESFPAFDESKLIENAVEIPVQLLGKLKGTITIELDEPQASVEQKALALLGNVTPKKVIYIKSKIINIIA